MTAVIITASLDRSWILPTNPQSLPPFNDTIRTSSFIVRR